MISNLHRRNFLSGSACGCLLANDLVAQSPTTQLVDTHLHCFAGPRDTKFPYHERAPYRPTTAATPQYLIKCMNQAGVAAAIVVHPEPYQDDHRYLEYCLEVGEGRLKGALLLFADRPGSLAKITDLATRLDIIAVRIHAYAPNRLPPFGTPQLRSFWRQAGELGLAVQLHFEPRYAPGFEPLVREFSTTRVIIDHLGRPFQGTPDEYASVIRWSRFPNTVIKFSAIPSKRDYPHRDVQPIVRQVTNAFGVDRIIYGGGFRSAATGQTYQAAFERARARLGHLSTTDQNKVLGENAHRLFFS